MREELNNCFEPSDIAKIKEYLEQLRNLPGQRVIVLDAAILHVQLDEAHNRFDEFTKQWIKYT